MTIHNVLIDSVLIDSKATLLLEMSEIMVNIVYINQDIMYDPKDRKTQVFQIIGNGAIKINKFIASRNKGKKLKQSSKIWMEGKVLIEIKSSN